MGDHRATIKISFDMHGHKAEHEMWINWSPDSNGVDRRITEWFEEQAAKAMNNWFEAECAQQERDRAVVENAERQKLGELKRKYETT